MLPATGRQSGILLLTGPNNFYISIYRVNSISNEEAPLSGAFIMYILSELVYCISFLLAWVVLVEKPVQQVQLKRELMKVLVVLLL